MYGPTPPRRLCAVGDENEGARAWRRPAWVPGSHRTRAEERTQVAPVKDRRAPLTGIRQPQAPNVSSARAWRNEESVAGRRVPSILRQSDAPFQFGEPGVYSTCDARADQRPSCD